MESTATDFTHLNPSRATGELEPLSTDYAVEINGRAVPTYIARVSAVPFNQVWPGYQRPLDQTELAAFASWDMTGPVDLKITSTRAIEHVTIRPATAGIQPKVEGNVVRFKLDRPRQFTVEINGHHHALHCFANPPESGVPSPGDPNLIYFGPGVHRPGVIRPTTGQRIYLAEGAVVHATIQAKEAHHLRIGGRGILDASSFPRFDGGGCICLLGCHDCVIEGITLRDSDVWTVIAMNCHELEIRHLKLIGLWRYNADGIDICNSQKVRIRDCFVRAFDDCIVLKGMSAWVDYPAGELPVDDVVVERCVLWCDWGRALELGAETVAPFMRDIAFRDCDVIHATHVAMDIQHGDRAHIEKISFENISVELNDGFAAPQMQEKADAVFTGQENSGYLPQLMTLVIAANFYSKDNKRGDIARVLYKNIHVIAPSMPASEFQGLAATCDISDVTIEGLTLNDKPITTLDQARISMNEHVRDVKFLKE